MWRTVLHPACENELRELKKANDELLTKVIYDLMLLREFGLELLGESRVKKLTDEVYELRTRLASDINRVLFGIRKERVILLAASFVKKSQKTPERWVKTAESRLRDWSD